MGSFPALPILEGFTRLFHEFKMTRTFNLIALPGALTTALLVNSRTSSQAQAQFPNTLTAQIDPGYTVPPLLVLFVQGPLSGTSAPSAEAGR